MLISSIVFHFLPALDPLPVSDYLELSIKLRPQIFYVLEAYDLGSQDPSRSDPQITGLKNIKDLWLLIIRK